MATETLNIDLTADNKQAIASFVSMNNTLKQFESAIKKATNPQEILYLQRSIDTLKNKIKDVPAEINKLGSAVKSNNQNWQNFGRVLQDAPYGFQGIQNNLTQLIPSIGALGFAFTAVVSAITFAQTGFSNWTRNSKAAKEAQDELKKSLDSERESATKSISEMKALVAAADNVALSDENRLIAVKKLRSDYPAYFKDLTDEQILTGNVTTATNSLTKAILARAEARAREADIAKKANQVVENETRLAKVNEDLAKARVDAVKGSMTATGGGSLGGLSGATMGGAEKAAGKLNTLLKERSSIIAEQYRLNAEIEESQTTVNSLFADSIGLDGAKDKEERLKGVAKILDDLKNKLAGLRNQFNINFISQDTFDVEALKEYNTALDQLSKLGLKGAEAFKKLTTAQDELFDKVFAKKMELLGRDTSELIAPKRPAEAKPTGLGAKTAAQAGQEQTAVNIKYQETLRKGKEGDAAFDLDEKKKKTMELAAVADEAANAFSNLFSDMANGASLGEALGNVFSNLATQIATAAAKAALFAGIFSLLGGDASALAGGKKEGGGGGGFLGLFKGLLGFDSGGVSRGPKGGYMVKLHGTENVTRPEQMGQLLTSAMNVGAMKSGNSDMGSVLVTKWSGTEVELFLERTRTANTYRR